MSGGFFYNSRHDRLYPVSRIKHITPTFGADKKMSAVTLDDGEVVIVYPSDVDEIVAHSAPVIPAAQGTFLLSFPSDAWTEWFVVKVPVIAWALSIEDGPVPVTTEGVNGGFREAGPILHPSGMVENPHESWWDSLADFEAAMQAAHEATRERARDSAAGGEPSAAGDQGDPR